VIPGPRPSAGLDWPQLDRGDGATAPLAARPPAVALIRTGRGWSVVSPEDTEGAADVIEGLTLADLVAEKLGLLVEPDRTARRSARGPAAGPDDPANAVDARVATLERTVAQLEHALAARVSTERAIGVLAERNRTSPRAAFESLRRDARSQGRPVAELAREVLDSLRAEAEPDDASSPPAAVVAAVASSLAGMAPLPAMPPGPAALAAGDGLP
jgi:hypothetical protein